MMSKTAILTSEESFHNNYGAVLQGYALYTTVQEMGCEPIIVRYRGGTFIELNLYRKFRHRLGIMYRNLFPSDEKKRSMALRHMYEAPIREREAFFLNFQRETMTFFSQERLTWPQLKTNPPVANVYLCGSDQIWNPYFKSGRNDPGYFLAFAPEGARKIAYAPSFGCSDLPESAREDIEDLLRDFSAISVRERSGVEIVRKYAHKDAELVLDPTLLRTPQQWREISRIPQNLPEKYILCYRFAESERTKSTINAIAKMTGLPVCSLPLSDVALADPYQLFFEAGPREFVGMIDRAALVLTDSFHATVFSILMNTPVCVFLRESYQTGNSMNSRVYNLLEMLGLTEHILKENDSVEKAVQCLELNYEHAYELLEEHRQRSLRFLERALKE